MSSCFKCFNGLGLTVKDIDLKSVEEAERKKSSHYCLNTRFWF